MRRFVPYLNGWRDAAEPDSLYLWDAAARAGLSYRTYGEFVGTLSADDVAAFNRRKPKAYPDVSPTVATVPAKQALEANHNAQFRAFDMWTPDAHDGGELRRHAPVERARGPARLDRSRRRALPRHVAASAPGWMTSARHVADLEAGRGDHLPALSILHLPNDHTVGVTPGLPTPQFHMADNDYALGTAGRGRVAQPLLEEHGHSRRRRRCAGRPRSRGRAPLAGARDQRVQPPRRARSRAAQHRVADPHDGAAARHPADEPAGCGCHPDERSSRTTADLEPYTARLPEVALDNLVYAAPTSARERYWVGQTAQMALTTPDAAQPAPAERGDLVFGAR